MGGAAPVESGKKGKKSLDAELNLVPFIDLLSCLISFLLITAVWTQISSVRVASTGGLSNEEQPPKEQTTIDIRVTMTERGYALSLAGNMVDMPKVAKAEGGTTFDSKQLVEKLKLVKQQYPEQRAVTVAAEDAIGFEELVATVDAISVNADLPDISVTPAVN
jgi:biopolymer transport protein ExbD